MQISRFDHLHVFENDRDAAVSFFSEILGNRWIGMERPHVNLRVAFSDDGLEVIQPTGQDRLGISEYLERHGPGIGSVGLKVPDIEEAITEFESKGVRVAGRGSYVTRPDIDIKAAIFKPESAHGVPLELVEYRSMTPVAIASLNWIREMPWMQPPVKPKSANSISFGRNDYLNLFQYELEESVKFFANLLGIKFIGPIEQTKLKLRMAFSDAGINIIQATGKDRLGVADYMKKYGEGVGSLGFKVLDIESAISELESKGVRLIGRGIYADNPNSDIKAAVFDPDCAYGIMLELVEYQDTTPVAVANLNWIHKLPWMK